MYLRVQININSVKMKKIIILTLSHINMLSDDSFADNFLKTLGQEEIAQNKQFLYLPQFFSIFP